MATAVHVDDVSILASLADPIRLRIVKRLSGGREVAGVTLAKELGISRALLCHHAGLLVETGVATKRKVGQRGYLRLNVRRVQRCLMKLGLGAVAPPHPTRPSRVGARPMKPNRKRT